MSYTANDIETLDFRSAIRKRIEMYMGSADNQGVLQCAREIISNCIDEAIMGYGSKIIIEYLGNNRLRVTDEGRGCPFGVREDGTEALEAIYMTAHSGGKFSDKTYQSVIGANGIGGKGVALSSDEFTVISKRNGERATLKIKNGYKESFTIDKVPTSEHGTVVEYVPSQEVYRLEQIKTDFEAIKKMCKDWAYLNKGITFVLKNYETKENITLVSRNGLLDLIKDQADGAIHTTPVYYVLKDGAIEAEVAMMWTKGKEKSFTFTNGLHQSEGGTSLTGVKTAITNFIKKQFKGEFDGEMARTGLVYAVACKIPNPSFANQTKTKINNPELRGIAQRAAGAGLEEFTRKKANEFQIITDFLAKERKAEQAAERARRQVLDAVKDIEKNQKKKMFASDKLKDAEFLGENSTLLIAEGDSALGGLALGRDYTKYGIMAIRGKIINALSNPDEKVYNNEEIKLLLSALNIIPGKYDSKKLRYGKLAICTDADSDGYHIGLLIMAALAHLAPEFIKEGRLCWLRSPLYIVTNGKTESYYFTDEEFNAVKGKIKGEVQRNKGLGSLEPEQAKKSMFDPTYQRMDIMEYSEDAMNLLYDLMGEAVEPRREFIMSNVDFSEIKE